MKVNRLGLPVAFALCALATMACKRSESTVTERTVVPEPSVTPPNPLDVIATKTTLADALAVAKPLMEIDKPGDSSPGTFLLALWSLEHLRWQDVALSRDETSYAKVRKDIDAERTKRLCVPGTIIQIEAFKQHNGTLFGGLMLSEGGNLFHFNGVQSSGDLVERSSARFCGIVTGKYDYANSAGGEGHAIDVVGMFDLPQNRGPAAPSPAPAPRRAGAPSQAGSVVVDRKPSSGAAPSPPPAPSPAPAPPPRAPQSGGCNCAAGDLACAMKCSGGR
jgi:hypothetical protein